MGWHLRAYLLFLCYLRNYFHNSLLLYVSYTLPFLRCYGKKSGFVDLFSFSSFLLFFTSIFNCIFFFYFKRYDNRHLHLADHAENIRLTSTSVLRGRNQGEKEHEEIIDSLLGVCFVFLFCFNLFLFLIQCFLFQFWYLPILYLPCGSSFLPSLYFCPF